MKITLASFLAAGSLVACGGKGGDAPPPLPYTGAPVAFEVVSFKPGKMFDGELQARVYNFSDKTIAQYSIMLRSYDDKGERIAVDPERKAFDHESYSFAGASYKCPPKSWCTFKLEPAIAAGAKKVVVLADRVTAVKADGMTMEEEPLFDLDGLDWPEPPGAKAAAVK